MSADVPVLGELVRSRRTARFDERTLRDLDVAPGDTVAIRGADRALARVGDVLEGDPGIRASTDVLQNAGVEVGDRVAVSEVTATAAASVTLAPPRAFRFEGIGDTLRETLRSRAVVRGDEVRPTLFGGSLEVRFVVVDVSPVEPGLVTPDTEVSVRDEPIGPAERMGTVDRRYGDIGGLEDAVEDLHRAVQYPLEHPDAYRSLAGRPANGVLLTGPPGSGKTLLADAVGNETDARYIRIPHPDVIDSRYDRGFDSLAVQAARDAPTVVLLDDIDAMAGDDRRGRGRASEVGAFLDAVEGDDVVVIGTTANPEDVDPSLRRGGRFDQTVELGVPDRDDRLDILRTHAREVATAEDVDLASVADRTHGYVGADLLALVAAAARHAIARHFDPEDGAAAPATDGAVTAADFEAALESVTPSGMQGVRIERPEVTYHDIGGLRTAKREVIRAVEWPLQYPELLDRVATEAPSGILLHGLPGTGKTMLARAVANATDANFIAVEGPELLDRYVGESERGVREVFERAARNAPTVLFFDEIDALAPQRSGDSDTEVTERVVSQLLTELDGIEPRQEVVVIGATNRPDMIDPALLRPGRLERAVEVPMPDRDAREEIFATHAEGVPVQGVDFARLADRTEGYSGSDIEAVVREAGLLAVEEHLREDAANPGQVDPESIYVGASHFDHALDIVEPSVSEEMHQRYDDLVEELF
ncbi:MAG: AAA family ATPase [Halobacteriales archaeon]